MKRGIDWTLGGIARAAIRHLVVHPFIRLNYDVSIDGIDDALSCTDGAIIVANHISRLDGPFIVSTGWPYARIRPTAWHAEYTHWLQWPMMKLFGAVALGSPKHLPEDVRKKRTANAKAIMKKLLAAGRHLLIFAEGGITDGERTTIMPHLSGVHDLVEAFPLAPVLLVRLTGLEHSVFGISRVRAPFFSRLPVHVTIKRVDNVSLEGGPSGLNKRLEAYFNDGVPLPTWSRLRVVQKEAS